MVDQRTVLLVEDDADLRDSLRWLLEKDNYRVLTAANGSEALTVLAAETTIHLVVSDISMPKMNGLQLLENMLVMERPAPPLILLTGHGENEVVLQALRLGALDYLNKPITSKEFAKVVSKGVELGIQMAAIEREVNAENMGSKEKVAKAKRKIQLIRQAQAKAHEKTKKTG